MHHGLMGLQKFTEKESLFYFFSSWCLHHACDAKWNGKVLLCKKIVLLRKNFSVPHSNPVSLVSYNWDPPLNRVFAKKLPIMQSFPLFLGQFLDPRTLGGAETILAGLEWLFHWVRKSWPKESMKILFWLTWLARGAKPRRKMMERKKLLRRILHVPAVGCRGAVLHGLLQSQFPRLLETNSNFYSLKSWLAATTSKKLFTCFWIHSLN